MTVSLEKLKQEAPELVASATTAQDCLTQAGLSGHRAKVALVLDYSGSMAHLYDRGVVQRLTERVIGLATQIDDDGSIDVFAFGSDAWYLGKLSHLTFRSGIQHLTGARQFGTTNYAAAIDVVRSHLSDGRKSFMGLKFGRKTSESSLPVHVIFATDGDPDNEVSATAKLLLARQDPTFWNFMGIGHENFRYLKGLVQTPGFGHCGFFNAMNVEDVTDDVLFASMLGSYGRWVSERSGL